MALVASLRPDLRTVSDCACHRSGSAHARPRNDGVVENLGIQNLGEALLSQIQKENLQVVRISAITLHREFDFFVQRADNWQLAWLSIFHENCKYTGIQGS